MNRAFLCLFFVGAAFAQTPAEKAFRRGSYEASLRLLKEKSASRPGLLRGLIAQRRGDVETARSEFAKVVIAFEQGSMRDGAPIADAADAYQMLGRAKEANTAFRLAVERAPKDAGIRVRWGRLFLQTYNEAEAFDLFQEATRLDPDHPGALTGIAEVLSDRWDGGADKIAEQALAADPEFLPAIVLQARHALEDDKPGDAAQLTASALKLDSDSLEALAMDAAVAYQRGDAAETNKRIEAVLRRNPRYGEVYSTLAHFAELRRQFGEARDFYKLATEKNPTLWKAHAGLGMAWLRLGRDAEARRSLEIAYAGDPYNTWTVNTLRLMDSYKNFEQFETASFRVKLHQKEAAVLRPYVEELLERSLAMFVREYKFKPPEKTSFEMFPDHEDFAVRTLGVPGLGALGASFGPVVAMDSPTARPVGDFHWGSTLWHEVAHVVTLQSTGNRVPRWLTEGLSVFEEWRAGWGDHMTLDVIKGLHENRLIPVADLNKGFIRPSYPGQVQFAYYEAGMLCRYIVEKHGWEKMLALLEASKRGEETSPTMERVLARPGAQLDKEFRAWMEEKTGTMVKAVDLAWRQVRPRPELEAEAAAHPNNFFAQVHLANALKESGQRDQALAHAQAARDLFPEFTGIGNTYELAAGIYLDRGDKEQGAKELTRWAAAGGMNQATAKKLAALLVDLHRPAEAVKVLESFLYISPQDPEIHQRLGELYLEAARHGEAVREYTVGLALKPVDMAQAHYNLARALAAANRRAEARTQALAALEVAPNFGPAQKLLLELTGNEGKS